MKSKLNCTIQSQTGAALMAFILLLLLSSTYIFAKKLNQQSYSSIRTQTTLDSLARAKEALIAYAVMNYERNPPPGPPAVSLGKFGFLPCPDINTALAEGAQDDNCAGQDISSVGRLPWLTLGLNPLRDGSGECLWYAVSGTYKTTFETAMLNEDTRGAFEIARTDGSFVGNSNINPNQRIVAVIIAPGDAINNQNRATAANTAQCGGNYQAAQYLDTFAGINNSNVGAVGPNNTDRFISFDDLTEQGVDRDSNGLADGNDMIITITADELWNAVRERSDFVLYDNSNPNNLTLKIAECLAAYGNTNAVNNGDLDLNGIFNQSLPWPAPISLADYRIDNFYIDRLAAGAILAGRLPIIINNSDATIYTAGCGGVVANCNSPTALNGNNMMTFCSNTWQAAGLTAVQATELTTLWTHWKDHLFYAVSQQFQPQELINETAACNNGQFCVTTDNTFALGGTQDWAAIVFFSDQTLTGQSRISPPLDAIDEKNAINNYLEDVNVNPYNNGDGNQFYTSAATVAPEFNDRLYCIQDDDGLDGIAPFAAGLCP